MVCTNDEDFYHLLLSIRSHGWDRDLPDHKKTELRQKHNISDFKSLYTFYYPGFNLRCTDLQAFIGIKQMDSIDTVINNRKKNFDLYNKLLKNNIWKINPPNNSFVSNFAYPLITEKIDELVIELQNNNIECRPLICGSMNEQPFWYNIYGSNNLPNAKKVHEFGLYLPNHHDLTEKEIIYITDIVNKTL
jgi:CDP-6-deoxy-D-xylo-4-hexulose-3-dehydrase